MRKKKTNLQSCIEGEENKNHQKFQKKKIIYMIVLKEQKK